MKYRYATAGIRGDGMDGSVVPNSARLDKFSTNRGFLSSRSNAKELLQMLGLTPYHPKLICRKTHGIVAHNRFGIRYVMIRRMLYPSLCALMRQAAVLHQ